MRPIANCMKCSCICVVSDDATLLFISSCAHRTHLAHHELTWNALCGCFLFCSFVFDFILSILFSSFLSFAFLSIIFTVYDLILFHLILFHLISFYLFPPETDSSAPGPYPGTVAVTLCGLDTIKTKGESVAILLALVGAEPVREVMMYCMC